MDKQELQELSKINDSLKMFTAKVIAKKPDKELTKLAVISNSLCTLTYDMKVKSTK